MKKMVLLLCIIMVGAFSSNYVTAQCSAPYAAYDSNYPPPYNVSDFSCLQDFFDAQVDAFCCEVMFDAFCYDQLRAFCNSDGNTDESGNPTIDGDCFLEKCAQSTGTCTAPIRPGCPNFTDPVNGTFINGVCGSYYLTDINLHPPGPELPIELQNFGALGDLPVPLLNGMFMEIVFTATGDGDCCVSQWDGLCTGRLDSVACFNCNDGNPLTLDAVNEKVGCTFTEIGDPASFRRTLDVDLKVFLEGPYMEGTGMMSTLLRDEEILPAAQPFNRTPWNYAGTEAVASSSDLPPNAVDWVLVEFRWVYDHDQMLGAKAGILLSDGTIVNADGSQLTVDNLFPNYNYRIVVRSRNHLPIMSSIPVFLPSTTEYNFSEWTRMAAGDTPMKLLEGSLDTGQPTILQPLHIWGAPAGDINSDGVIDGNDFDNGFVVAAQDQTISAYNDADINWDTYVTYTDFNAFLAAIPTTVDTNIGYTAPGTLQIFPSITDPATIDPNPCD